MLGPLFGGIRELPFVDARGVFKKLSGDALYPGRLGADASSLSAMMVSFSIDLAVKDDFQMVWLSTISLHRLEPRGDLTILWCQREVLRPDWP